MKLYIDFKSPGAYLALPPSLRLIDTYGLDVQWCAFDSKQQAIPEQLQNEDIGARHRRVRANARRDTHLLYARLRNIPMQFPPMPGVTRLALAVMTHLSQTSSAHTQPFISAAFNAYWVTQDDLNDPAVVAHLLQQVGAQQDLLDGIDCDTLLQSQAALAEADGIVDAPAYVLQDQLFIGREHLPWIEQILSGNR